MKFWRDNVMLQGDSSTIDMTLYHILSLQLLTHLHTGCEQIAHDILSSIVFNIDFLR